MTTNRLCYTLCSRLVGNIDGESIRTFFMDKLYPVLSTRSPAIATHNCPTLFSTTYYGGTKNSLIAVEGPTKKSVSDGMIESASMDIKYELKRAIICTKRLDTSFIYLGFSNVAFDQLVGHQQA